MAEKTVDTNLASLLGTTDSASFSETHDIQGHTVLVVHDLLSASQCHGLVAATNDIGYGTTLYAPCYRGNLRLMCDDPSLAAWLWSRLAPHVGHWQVHALGKRWRATGLNPRFRFSKYPLGTRFCNHVDTFYAASDTHRSFYTVNIYINSAHPAAGTRFNFHTEHLDVTPVAGKALIFPQPPLAHLLHEGLEVVGCEKYLMRTDIMFEAL